MKVAKAIRLTIELQGKVDEVYTMGWTQLLGQGRGNIKFGSCYHQGLRC